MRAIGIDPGLDGGLSLLTGGAAKVMIMPTVGTGGKGKSKRAIDLPVLVKTLEEWGVGHDNTVCCLERVSARPGQGVTSMFRFGTVYGILQGITSALRIPTQLVTPQAWKKVVLAGTAKDKDAAINHVKMRYPEVSLLPTPRCRKDHDGMAEAICLAEYAHRLL